MMEDVALSRTLRRGRRALVPGGARVARGRDHGGETLEAFEGDERVERGGDRERPDDRVRRGGGRRRRAARHDARREGRARGRTTGSSATRRCRPRSRGSTRPATSAPTRAWSTAAGSGSSTGTWRCSRGMHAAPGMLGESEPYDVVPYFFSDLADWASLEYVGPGARVGRGDLARRPRRRRVRVWYLKDGKVAGGARRSSAPRTWATPGGCSPRASMSRAARTRSPTPTAISPSSTSS